MGLFDYTYADVKCPRCEKITWHAEVQFKVYSGKYSPCQRQFRQGQYTDEFPKIPIHWVSGDCKLDCGHWITPIVAFRHGVLFGVYTQLPDSYVGLPVGRNTERKRLAEEERQRRSDVLWKSKSCSEGTGWDQLGQLIASEIRDRMRRPNFSELIRGPSDPRYRNHTKRDGKWTRMPFSSY